MDKKTMVEQVYRFKAEDIVIIDDKFMVKTNKNPKVGDIVMHPVNVDHAIDILGPGFDARYKVFSYPYWGGYSNGIVGVFDTDEYNPREGVYRCRCKYENCDSAKAAMEAIHMAYILNK